nr:hypothetical protein [Candidatus Cloacimonadota bacterium]
MSKPDRTLIYPLFIPNEACPGGCVYCDQRKISGVESFDLDAAIPALQAFIRRNLGRKKEIAFYGGSFTAMPLKRQEMLLSRVFEILDEYTSIRISTHPAYLKDAALELCHKYRVKTIELGIQDFCDRPLRESGRNYNGKEALEACCKVRSDGFTLGVQLIPGLPGSNAQTLKTNIEILGDLAPDLLRLYPLVVIKGTLLEGLYRRGEYRPLQLSEAVSICADYTEYCLPLSIRIIKYGLPSNLDPEDVVAGAFHPAFGELVKQELLIRKLEKEPDLLAQLDAQQIQLLRAHKCSYLNSHSSARSRELGEELH